MNSSTAQTVIIAGVGLAVITTVIKELTSDNTKRAPAIFVPLGGVLVAVPLLVIADVQPDIAGMLGGLIGLGALVYNSGSINSITKGLNTAKLPPNQNPSSQRPQT